MSGVNISKTMRMIAMNLSVIVFPYEIIIHALLSHLHDCTFKGNGI